MITFTIYGLYILKIEKSTKIKKRISILKQDRSEHEQKDGTQESRERRFYERIVLPIWKEFKRSFKRRMPGEKAVKLELKLLLQRLQRQGFWQYVGKHKQRFCQPL